MSIRIRVYPQHSAFGLRGSRAAARKAAAMQRQINLANWRLQRQLGSTIPGGNAYGSVYQSNLGLPSSMFGVPGSLGWRGAWSYPTPIQSPLGGIPYRPILPTLTSPFGVSQLGASPFGISQAWAGAWPFGVAGW